MTEAALATPSKSKKAPDHNGFGAKAVDVDIERGHVQRTDLSGLKPQLTRLQLNNFRSYRSQSIDFDGRPVTFSGENGAGKTNILEALSLLGPGRGMRSARLHEYPRLEGDGSWAISLRLDDGEDERVLGVGAFAQTPERRQCRIDGRAATGPTAFTALVRFLWLTPAQDRLFMEGASDRRRFFDRMISAHDGGFRKTANAYEQSMRQRQKLLEAGRHDETWLTALEQQMAEHGVAIADARRSMALILAEQDIAGSDGLFPAADIALEGEIEAALVNFTAGEVEDDFAERLKRGRGLDREAGRCLYGPHRSDLIVGHRPKARPARLCSTGEQKALLIGLVLANASALVSRRHQSAGKAATDTTPLVLLLDEIAAHLDEERRARLFDILEGLEFPVFMTGADHSLFSAWGERAQHFSVTENKVQHRL